jgi:ankyrin repeat protein
LIQASIEGKLEAGQYLLDRGADINFQNKYNRTPLFMAVFYGHVEYVRMLLKRGAKTNTHDTTFGNTPLHWAVRKGNIQVVRLLLEHGADVNLRDNRGKTPSQWTSDHEIKELLSKYGAESVK